MAISCNTLNETVVIKLLKVVDAGLTRGKGQPIPGRMCVEAAVCYALGLPHSDEPDCVNSAVRAFKIRLNDARWPSNTARAVGLRKVAVAQLGSRGVVNSKDFAKNVVIATVNRLLPLLLQRFVAKKKVYTSQTSVLATECLNSNTLTKATAAAQAVKKFFRAADAAAYAYAADAAADAAAYAAYAAYTAADAAAADAYAAYAAYTAADAAAADAAAAAAAYTYAAYAADAAAAYADVLEILTLSADICLQALIQLNSPGCKYLYLTE